MTTTGNGYTVRISAAGFRGRHVAAEDLEDASRKVREFIDDHGLGSSDWTGGELRLDGKKVGHISYNGRAWTLDGRSA